MKISVYAGIPERDGRSEGNGEKTLTHELLVPGVRQLGLGKADWDTLGISNRIESDSAGSACRWFFTCSLAFMLIS
ncbi:MAG: hypothetical protein PSV24_14485 [Rhodoferax sp.]|nr:hypothetical protein [Rhodoferax sp.]